MLCYDDILFSLYGIKEDAKILNNIRENVKPDDIKILTSRIIEQAKAAIYELKSEMRVENLKIEKAFEEINRRENADDEEEET